MKHLIQYKIFETKDISSEVRQTINDMSLDLIDSGLIANIETYFVHFPETWVNGRYVRSGTLHPSERSGYCFVDIIIWKHKGDYLHIPYTLDRECIDFLLSLNSYMLSNEYKLKNVTINTGGSEPNLHVSHAKVIEYDKRPFADVKLTIIDNIEKLYTETVEEVSICFFGYSGTSPNYKDPNN